MCGHSILTFEKVKEIQDFLNDAMEAHVVSKEAGNVRNNFKELVESV